MVAVSTKEFLAQLKSIDSWLVDIARKKKIKTPEKLVEELQRYINASDLSFEEGRMTPEEEEGQAAFLKRCQRLRDKVIKLFKL